VCDARNDQREGHQKVLSRPSAAFAKKFEGELRIHRADEFFIDTGADAEKMKRDASPSERHLKTG